MKTLSTMSRLTVVVMLLAASALWAAPISSRIKHRAQGDESARAADKTNTPNQDSHITLLNGSPAVEAATRGVEVTDIGPERGIVFGLDGFLIDPGNPREILASTQIGVFKSADAGKSWRPAGVGLTAFGRQVGVPNIRRDPSHPRTVYGVSVAGLYRSIDFGEHWSQLSFISGLDMAVSPADSSVLFLMSHDVLYKSTDGGTTLVPQSGIGLPETDFALGIFPLFTNVVITPSDPQAMYVVDERHGVYKSTSGGASFSRLSASPILPGQVFPHPTQGDTIFVEAFAGSTTALFRSLDGGATFTEVTGGLPPAIVQFITFDREDPLTLYASSAEGLLRSTDGGFTFKSLGLTPEQLDVAQGGAITLTIDPANSRVLYVNTGRGNFKSTDRGRSFREIDKGFRATQVSNVAFDNDEDPSLYVIADGILFRTRDRGKHWEEITLPPDSFPVAVAVAPTNRNRIVITTSGAGVLLSTDGGRSWSASLTDIDFFHSQIAIDPQDDRNVFVASDSLFRSTDGGQTFTTTPDISQASVLAIDPQNSNVIYLSGRVGTAPTALLLKSSDGGLTFANALTAPGLVNKIIVDPRDSKDIYVGGTLVMNPFPIDPNFVLRSKDGGVTFMPADAGLKVELLAFGIDPVEPTRLFAMCPAGLFETADGGTNWSLLDPGGETFLREPDQLAVNPRQPRLLYLGGLSLLEVETKR